MLLGVGVDLIEKERFEGWLSRPGVRRRFAPAELAYAEGFVGESRRREAVASAFAAKEAFFKAASALLDEDDADTSEELFWGVCLEHELDGLPWLRVSEPWERRLRELGARRFLVSVSHDRSQVLAVVLITDGRERPEEAEKAMQSLVPTGFTDLAAPAGDILRVDDALAAGMLPRRARDAHKGNFGHVLVIGGSARYVGAPKLAAEAALRGGAGLVTLAAPEHIYPASPEIMRLPLPLSEKSGGCLGGEAAAPLWEFMQGKVPVIGMGLGREPETCRLVHRLATADVPKVIDADGLFALAAAAEDKRLPDNTVLTPHTGEMARLLDCTAAEVEADRLAAARRCAAEYHAVVVLKGPGSLICGPEGTYVNTTGNPGMAGGGSGDVLAGLIGAWLAQGPAAGLSVQEATALAVYLHGLAGDLAAAAKSEYAMTAMDIVKYLPEAYKTLLV